ncbi:MAP3K12-binding inhibitory protein 1 [Exaiptasia diaphana]|uniref:MAP3K12-binding inhibitory protein 1 n=1 Tax=Exaiptasia diaphana TaxID=2652724 RepID=A0A913XXC6_EXADI|nr:MAP3K12-binding inhibitory protein 1 [Exaiptasia diaphana]XP_020911358.1 MAP3K12-binding inhibitory protein 1 [Exaiptasia diaphana]KXJ08204.1 MAP3K12-binding inhibitory protein 1 [Exaiptasia diaphana]
MECTLKSQKLIVQVLYVIENTLKQSKLADDGVQLDINYNKVDNSAFTNRDGLILIRSLVEELQKLKADYEKKSMDSGAMKMASDDHDDIEWSLVQVKADKAEIDRRISAFIQQKQNEVDMVNKREFCNIVDASQESQDVSCARTDALFVPRFGQKSHIKVTRVGNTSTSDEAQALGKISDITRHYGKPKVICSEPSVTERLHNLENHLGFSSGGPVAHDIYEVLKQLENRVLFLESLSPEYFNPHTLQRNRSYVLGKQSTISPSYEGMSLDAIDERIAVLKNSLHQKTRN